MTDALKTEYDMREVAAHKFWQDARTGDLFRLPAGAFPERTFRYDFSEHSEIGASGAMYLPVWATRTDEWDGRTYDYYLPIPIDDRIIWYKQVPWKGMTD